MLVLALVVDMLADNLYIATVILPILGRQNPENKNYLENFLKSLKKRLTKQH